MLQVIPAGDYIGNKDLNGFVLLLSLSLDQTVLFLLSFAVSYW